MILIDLTNPIPGPGEENAATRIEEWNICSGDTKYTGMVYQFAHNGMQGSFIDLPGHIKETDDGMDAAGYPLEQLFRVDAVVIHLDRADGSGEITANELQQACATELDGGALIINALDKRRFYEFEDGSIWLGRDALQWIIDSGVHLLVSDVWERKPQLGVFYYLFDAGITTVLRAINLHLLTAPRVKLTALPARFNQVTQLPCRVLAEIE